MEVWRVVSSPLLGFGLEQTFNAHLVQLPPLFQDVMSSAPHLPSWMGQVGGWALSLPGLECLKPCTCMYSLMFEGPFLCADVSLIYALFITLKQISEIGHWWLHIRICPTSLQELHLVWMSLSASCLFLFVSNIYLVCYLRGEHIVCSKALMRINQRKGEREQRNLSLLFF